MRTRGVAISLLAAVLCGVATSAAAQTPPPPADRAAIDKRLIHRLPPAETLNVVTGDTVLVELREVVPTARLAKGASEFEGTITSVDASGGIVVHPRVDEIRIESRGEKSDLILVYALQAPNRGKGKQSVNFVLTVLERAGLGNTIFKSTVEHGVALTTVDPTPAELHADFWGYRLYKKLAEEKLAVLKATGLKLKIEDNAPMPPLDRAPANVAKEVFEFERLRRRIWIARRHLEATLASKNTKLAGDAKNYLSNLDRKDAELKGLPLLVDAKPAGKVIDAGILKPERTEPADANTARSGGTVAPVTRYEPNSESDEADAQDTPPAPPPEPVAKPEPDAPKPVVTKPAPALGGEDDDEDLDDDPFSSGVRVKQKRLPTYPRALVLDDPNIAHAAGMRMSYASLNLRGTSAIAPAFFFYAHAALTQNLGAELTIPTTLVDLDLDGTRSRFEMGNPLVAAKYRMHFSEVQGRPPVLTIRARAGLPLSSLNRIPPTDLRTEEFAAPAHFADTYAFLSDKMDLGLGASVAWQYDMFYVASQLYLDYFLPVCDTGDGASFPTLAWGLSGGVLPFGNIVGFYVEGRSTTLFSGPGRTELFSYLGARTHFAKYLEAAVWGSLPIGSISRVSGFQIGFDLRFTYDLKSVLRPATATGESNPERSPF